MNNGMRTLCGLPDKTNRRRLLAAGALAVLSALCSLLPMLGLYVILDALLSNPRDVSQAYSVSTVKSQNFPTVAISRASSGECG